MGMPKVAPLTHHNLLVINSQTELLGSAAETKPLVFFCGLPLFHINGADGDGGRAVVDGVHAGAWQPAGLPRAEHRGQFWELVVHHCVAWFSGAPTVFSRLL